MDRARLMAMVDPWSEAMAASPSPNGMPPTDTSSDLKKLFDAWGIVFDPTKVVGDLTGAWRVRANADERVQAVNSQYERQGELAVKLDDKDLAALDRAFPPPAKKKPLEST